MGGMGGMGGMGRRGGGGAQMPNPIDALAKMLRIDHISIPIPAVSFLGITASNVGLVYFVLLGVLYLMLGVKAVIFGAFVYIMYKHGERVNNR
jgi:hypothetical protein